MCVFQVMTFIELIVDLSENTSGKGRGRFNKKKYVRFKLLLSISEGNGYSREKPGMDNM